MDLDQVLARLRARAKSNPAFLDTLELLAGYELDPIDEARHELIDQLSELVMGRAGETHTLSQVCERLDVDVEQVRRRARELNDAK